MRHTVVIGAGASGALVATQLKRLAPLAPVTVVGDTLPPGRGVAYSTPFAANLLNVPAGDMSALADDPDHFLRWLRARLPAADSRTFAERRLYGAYLGDLFAAAGEEPFPVEVLQDTAVGLTRRDGGWTVTLASGRRREAPSVVLALGNLQVPGDPLDFGAVAGRYRRNPWAPDIAGDLDPQAPVLLVGTGLTMVDVALSLRESGHRGPLHALSRRGRLYQAHRAAAPVPRPVDQAPADFASPTGALRWLRRQAAAAARQGSDWRAVVDSLRPHTAGIWQGWSLARRGTFLRHARNLWDMHRHRMAPEVAAEIDSLMARGILTLHRGRLESVRDEGSAALLTWRDAEGAQRTLSVARIFNCTGPARDFSTSRLPLVAELRAAGLLVPDPLRLGFETDPDGRFLDASGRPVPGLFTLGPLLIPALWESIAMPEIRTQALALARTLIATPAPAALDLAGRR